MALQAEDGYHVPQITVGVRMRIARETGEHTVAEVAEALGISEKTYTGLEKGRTSPRIDQVERLSAFLRVPVEWLLTGRASSPPRPLTAHNPRSVNVTGVIPERRVRARQRPFNLPGLRIAPHPDPT